MKNDLTTVKTVTYAHEAAIFWSKIESAGILCHVQDELTVQVHPFLSNAIGGVKLQVREEDAEKAIQVLNEGNCLASKLPITPNFLSYYRPLFDIIEVFLVLK